MINKHIEELIEKFAEGLTTNEEEKELYSFFNSENVPEYLQQYIPVFGYFNKGLCEEVTKIKPKKKKRNKRILITSVAAAIAILITVFIVPNNFDQYAGSYIIKDGKKFYNAEMIETELNNINTKMIQKELEIENISREIENTVNSGNF